MLDVCRHYMPVEDIKRLLRAAQFCGVNKMHWHLADDQGWRIEIKKSPRLTQVGAVRGDSFFGAVSETEHNCGFYTQEQAKDIVAYAQDCGIDVIPEIEIPGHAGAMLAAYPEFGCRRTVVDKDDKEQIIEEPYRYQVETAGGIFPHLICAGKDASVDFLKDILDEVSELFPYPAVHIGGDEAPKTMWQSCPDCAARMKKLGLSEPEQLQGYFTCRVAEMLRRHGKKPVCWNEALRAGRVPEDVQVIGYDGLRAFGDQDYYCSTIIQPVEELGTAAGEQILQRIEEPDAPVLEKVLTSAYRPYSPPGAWAPSQR